MTLTRIDHVTEGLALLLSQYKDKPRIEAVLTAFLDSIQPLEDGTLDVARLVHNLDEAVGDNLDICGAILDEARAGAPDFIYRRKLKTKVQVIRSQGRVEDLLKVVRTYQGAFLSGSQTPDSSDIYFATSQTWNGSAHVPEGRGMEITIIPANSNSYTDPKPFDPKGGHDQLILAKGAGEEIQTIWAIVGPNKEPKVDSLRLIHNPTGGLPSSSSVNGFGSVYVTGSNVDGTSIFGGSLGHRRQDQSIFAGPLEIFNVSTPLLTFASITNGLPSTNTTLRIVPGVWHGLPSTTKYDLLKEVSGSWITLFATSSRETIEAYIPSSDDLSNPLKIREIVTSPNVILSEESNELVTFDWIASADSEDSIMMHWTFDLISDWGDGTVRVIDQIGDNELDAVSKLGEPTITGSQIYLWNNDGVEGSKSVFDGNVQRWLMTQTSGSSFGTTLVQPIDGFVLFRPEGLTAISGAYIFGNTDISDDGIAINDSGEFRMNLANNVDTVVTASTDLLSAIYFRMSGSSSKMWVNDFRTTASASNGNIGIGNWEALTIGAANVTSNHFTGSIFEAGIVTGSSDSNSILIMKAWNRYISSKWGTSFPTD